MAAGSSSRSNPCSRSCADGAGGAAGAGGASRHARGASITELLVAMTVVLTVAAAAMSIAQSSRSLYNKDGARVAVDQNLGIGMNMLSIDVRQAGERVQQDLPAIEIVDGGANPDTIVIRRSLLDAVLPLCKTINAGSSADGAFVADKDAHPAPGCTEVPDTDGDGWPDNMQEWRNYRIANGGSVLVYIYDPVTHGGEFFTYDAEDRSTFKIHRASGTWGVDFPQEDGSRLYMIEQRQYQVQNGLLQLVINGNTAGAQNLVSNITHLNGRAFLDDGTVQDALGSGDNWTHLTAVEVLLTGQATLHNVTASRSLVTRLFPRNIMSR